MALTNVISLPLISDESPMPGTRAYFEKHLLDVPGVYAVYLYETGPLEACVVVFGGDDEDVAQALFEVKPLGLCLRGSVEMTITAFDGCLCAIRFDRPRQKADIKPALALPKDNCYLEID